MGKVSYIAPAGQYSLQVSQLLPYTKSYWLMCSTLLNFTWNLVIAFYAGYSARIGISGHKKGIYHASGEKRNFLFLKMEPYKDWMN
jgi:hypothetical protein